MAGATAVAEVCSPYFVVVPYCNTYVVALPLGLTVALRSAEVSLTTDGWLVAAVGGVLPVVKVTSAPGVLPFALVIGPIAWWLSRRRKKPLPPPAAA